MLASASTALLKPMAAEVRMLTLAFGRICRKMIRILPTPMIRALFTKSSSFARMTSLRTMRAKLGTNRMPRATMML